MRKLTMSNLSDTTYFGARKIQLLWIFFILEIVLGAMCASAIGSERWNEEVLLHDGKKLVIEREISRGGRHEFGQRPPIKQQTIKFSMPGSKEEITWEDEYSKDIGIANFLPMMLDIFNGTVYLVTTPMGCLSYNKWGRPKPQYVIFKLQTGTWQRIALQELPVELTTPNLIYSSPDDVARRFTGGIVKAIEIKNEYASYSQQEYKSILREPDKFGMGRCPELIYYKGGWIGPGDSIGKSMMDRIMK